MTIGLGYRNAREKTREHLGDIARVRWRGKFVRDCIDLPLFPRSLDDCVNKARPIGTEDPRDAHD